MGGPNEISFKNLIFTFFWGEWYLSAAFWSHGKILFPPEIVASQRSALMHNCMLQANFNLGPQKIVKNEVPLAAFHSGGSGIVGQFETCFTFRYEFQYRSHEIDRQHLRG